MVFVHADAYSRMKAGHESDGTPCQDYALAGSGNLYVVVSDGCSLSGRTDVGARVLALSAARVLEPSAPWRPEVAGDDGGRRPPPSLDEFRQAMLRHTAQAAEALGLTTCDLDATVGALVALPEGGARGYLIGDGAIAARYADRIEVTVVDWAGNMPGYPAYLLSEQGLSAFLEESAAAEVRHGRSACHVTRYVITRAGAEELGMRPLSAREGLRGIEVEWAGGDEQPDVVAVLTDGFEQVSLDDGTRTDWAEVVGELMAVKSARDGQFVARRMRRALQAFAKRGALPRDDISMAALAAEVADPDSAAA